MSLRLSETARAVVANLWWARSNSDDYAPTSWLTRNFELFSWIIGQDRWSRACEQHKRTGRYTHNSGLPKQIDDAVGRAPIDANERSATNSQRIRDSRQLCCSLFSL